MVRKYCLAGVLVFFVTAAALPSQAHDVPLGDGKISIGPRAGYLMSCVRHWRRPVMHGGPWIRGKEWDPAQKPSVAGRVAWPTSHISIWTEGKERVIAANNLPDHATGIFPISPADPAYRYDHNPNSIRARNILLHLPLYPVLAAQPGCVPWA